VGGVFGRYERYFRFCGVFRFQLGNLSNKLLFTVGSTFVFWVSFGPKFVRSATFCRCNQSIMHRDQVLVTDLTLTSIMTSRKNKCSIPSCDWRFSRNQVPVKIAYRISGIGTVLEFANKYDCGLTFETVR